MSAEITYKTGRSALSSRAAGHFNEWDNPFHHKSVRAMINWDEQGEDATVALH